VVVRERVHLKRPGTLGHDKIGLGRVVALCGYHTGTYSDTLGERSKTNKL